MCDSVVVKYQVPTLQSASPILGTVLLKMWSLGPDINLADEVPELEILKSHHRPAQSEAPEPLLC